MELLVANLDKVHTTEMGDHRIRKNLSIEDIEDVIEWCKLKIISAHDVVRKGKNWYVHADDIVITIHACSFTIITAHRKGV